MLLRSLPQLFEFIPASDCVTGCRLAQDGVNDPDVIAERVKSFGGSLQAVAGLARIRRA